MLSQEKLAHTLFPLGDLTKTQVRKIAEEHGLENAQKQESQDICFVPNGDYAGFLHSYTGHSDVPGNFVDMKGNILGQHQGLIHYTIGQRKGLGVAVGHPLYVVKKDAEKNEVVLGTREDLARKDFFVDDMHWTNTTSLADGLDVDAVTRYRGVPHAAHVTSAPINVQREESLTVDQSMADQPTEDQSAEHQPAKTKEDSQSEISPRSIHVVFDQPQIQIAPGQTAVLYKPDAKGDIVLGGGIIR